MASDAVVEAVAGAGGGIVALLATYPLMTVSTMQATRGKQRAKAAVLGEEPPPPPRSAFGEIIHTVETEGVGRLFAGIGPAVLGTGVSQAVYFYFYSLLREAAVARKHRLAGTAPAAGVTARSDELSVGASLAVASLAGCANVLLTNPIWVLSTRMQAKKTGEGGANGGEREPAHRVAAAVWQEDGLTGFWRGVLPSLVMVANPAVQYVLFEWLMARVREERLKHKQKAIPSGGEIFAAGALAKLGATLATYPMQLVKSRLMAASRSTEAHLQYKGTLDAVLNILRREGWKGFYSGMGAKMVQSVTAAAILFYIREEIVRTVQILIGRDSPVKKLLNAA